MNSWSPDYAPHVTGIYPNPTPDGDGGIEPAYVELSCSVCGDRSRASCATGAYRQKIAWYALRMHAHPEAASRR